MLTQLFEKHNNGPMWIDDLMITNLNKADWDEQSSGGVDKTSIDLDMFNNLAKVDGVRKIIKYKQNGDNVFIIVEVVGGGLVNKLCLKLYNDEGRKLYKQLKKEYMLKKDKEENNNEKI